MNTPGKRWEKEPIPGKKFNVSWIVGIVTLCLVITGIVIWNKEDKSDPCHSFIKAFKKRRIGI
jgi:cytochrome b subunit of formate dehydrogenase